MVRRIHRRVLSLSRGGRTRDAIPERAVHFSNIFCASGPAFREPLTRTSEASGWRLAYCSVPLHPHTCTKTVAQSACFFGVPWRSLLPALLRRSVLITLAGRGSFFIPSARLIVILKQLEHLLCCNEIAGLRKSLRQ